MTKKNLLAALLICSTFQLSAMDHAPRKVSLLRALTQKKKPMNYSGSVRVL